MSLSHSQLIECLRTFADELEELLPFYAPSGVLIYPNGGYQQRTFHEFGLDIRAEVKETQNAECISGPGSDTA